jgi:hypothetical protein
MGNSGLAHLRFVPRNASARDTFRAGLAPAQAFPLRGRRTQVGRVPDLAVESDGTLYVRYPVAGKTIVLIAQWPPDEAGAPAARYRAARLEVQSSPIDVEALAHTGRRVMLLPESEWDSLLTQLLTELAPSAPNEAALAVVQGEDIARAGGLKLYRHAQARGLARTRLVTEEEFSSRQPILPSVTDRMQRCCSTPAAAKRPGADLRRRRSRPVGADHAVVGAGALREADIGLARR